VHHQVDGVLATALRLRGCDVSMIRCDGIFRDGCDVLSWSGENFESDCASCVHNGKQLADLFGLPTIELRAQLNSEDYVRARDWSRSLEVSQLRNAMFEGRPLGDWVISSMCTYFRTTALGLDKPHIHASHRLHLFNAALAALAVERIYNQYAPSAAIVFNGRFSLYRIAAQIATDRGIRVLCHERGFTDDSFAISGPHMASAAKHLYEGFDIWGKIPLSEDQFTTVRNHLINRQSGKDLNWEPYYNYTSATSDVLRQLNIPANAKVFGCFTSSEFEIAYCDDFPSMLIQLEHIDNLIEIFRDRSDYLVVRHHPFMSGDRNAPCDSYFIQRAHIQARNAPSNVRIIMPYEQLTSYALFPHLSGCFVPISTVGIEAAAQGIPAAGLYESPARDIYNVHITTGDQQDFKKLLATLDTMSDLDRLEAMRRSYRFMSLLLQRISVKFQSFGIKSICQADIRFSDINVLRPGCDPAIDRLCNYLIDGSPWLPQPLLSDQNRSPTGEDQLLREELRGHDNARESLRQRKAQLHNESSLNQTVLNRTPTTAVVAIGGMDQLSQISIAKRVDTMNIYSLPSNPGADFGDAALTGLIQQLGQVSEPLVLVTWRGVEYDESFLSSAQKALENPDLNGAGSAVWIGGPNGTIAGEAFTIRRPFEQFDQAILAYPWLDNGPIELARFLCRRQWLIDVLTGLTTVRPFERSSALSQILRAPDVLRSPSPLVIITSPVVQALSEAAYERPNTAESIKELALVLLGQQEFERVVELVTNARIIGATARDLELLGAASLIKLQRIPEARYALVRELIRFPENDQARKFYRELCWNG